MGLDSVELVLSVETAFAITISDQAAAAMITVGDIHAFVVAELARQGRTDPSPEIAYDLLKNLVCLQLGVPREAVTPQARLVRDLGMD